MSHRVTPFLMFYGAAEEAMNFYVSLFPEGKVTRLVRHGSESPEMAGQVMRATFTIGHQTIMCIDSPAVHDFTFTPASSLFVECASEDELRRLYTALGDRGATLMPLGDYGFSRLFGWVNDRFGVSWQLNLA